MTAVPRPSIDGRGDLAIYAARSGKNTWMSITHARSTVRVEVPAERIPGELRLQLQRAAKWLERELRLPFLNVSFYVLEEASWNPQSHIQRYAAELGHELQTDSTAGYVEHATPSTVHVKADMPLGDMLETLIHEAPALVAVDKNARCHLARTAGARR
jgi:hypothetical protein